MNRSRSRTLNPCKLLHLNWTAVASRTKVKHFLVTKRIEPEPPGSPLASVELEEVYSRRAQGLPWRELNDSGRWLRGRP
jgi:tryptophan-rich hypothetical protein